MNATRALGKGAEETCLAPFCFFGSLVISRRLYKNVLIAMLLGRTMGGSIQKPYEHVYK